MCTVLDNDPDKFTKLDQGSEKIGAFDQAAGDFSAKSQIT